MGVSEQVFDEGRKIYTYDFLTIQMDLNMSMEEVYLVAFRNTKRILDDFRQRMLLKSRATDIRGLVEMAGIEIIEKPLASFNDRFSHETSGYLDCYDYKKDEFQWTIYVNNALGDLTKRYIIAHELAHFLIKGNKEVQEVYTRYCVSPLFPKDMEEQLCDIVASFLLMPIDSVLDLMKEYIARRNNEKIDTFEWLRFLGCQMGVSDYHTVICYQNVRYLGGFLYSSKSRIYDEKYQYMQSDFQSIIDKIEELRELFR